MTKKKARVAVAFGMVLRKWREKEGLSQSKVAAMAQCTPVYISNLERGMSIPSLETILTLEEALGMTHGFLSHMTAQVLKNRAKTPTS